MTETRGYVSQRLAIGSTTVPLSGSSLRLAGLSTGGGTEVLFINTTTTEVVRRTIGKGDLPAVVAYRDEFNNFTQANTFSSTVSITGLATFTTGVTGAPGSPFTAQGAIMARDTPAVPINALGFDNVRCGVNAGSPRCIFEDAGTSTKQWTVDNASDTLRVYQTNAAGAALQVPFYINDNLNLMPRSQLVLPGQPYTVDLGTIFNKFRALHVSEFWAETLVAQETLATLAGRILIGPTTTLLEGLTDVATTFKTAHNNLVTGDTVILQQDGKTEFIKVNSGPTRINKDQNANIEASTAGYGTSTGTLTRDAAFAYRGGYSLKAVLPSVGNDIYRSAGEVVGSTQYTCSIYLRRSDGAPIVYPGVLQGMTCAAVAYTAPDAIYDAGGGWYRIVQTQTTPGSPGAYLALALAAGTYYADAYQIELGPTATAWNENSASYTIARNQDLSGQNTWDAGSAVFNTGGVGSAFLDAYALRGVNPAITTAGPTICGNLRTTTAYNGFGPFWCIGNLSGQYGYGGATWGAAFGPETGPNIKIETTNGIRISLGTVVKFHADLAGNLNLTGDLVMGTAGAVRTLTATGYDTGTGYWLDYNGGTPRLRVGTATAGKRYMRWTGSDLEISNDQWLLDSFGIRFLSSAGTGFSRSIYWQAGMQLTDDTSTNTSWVMRNFGGTLRLEDTLFDGQFHTATMDITPTFIKMGRRIGDGTKLDVLPYFNGQTNFGSASFKWASMWFNDADTDNQTTNGNFWPLVSAFGRIAIKTNNFNGTLSCPAGIATLVVDSGMVRSGGC